MCRMESEMERLVAHKSQAQGRCAAAAPKLLQAVQDLEDSRRECVALVHSLSGSLCRHASPIGVTMYTSRCPHIAQSLQVM